MKYRVITTVIAGAVIATSTVSAEDQNFVNRAYTSVTKLAQQGNPNALFSLGEMNYLGIGQKKNYKMAVEYFSQAANKGHTKAAFNLGSMYYGGNGVDKSIETALKWFTKAAEQDDAKSMLYLASIYENDLSEHSKAFRWYSKAAALGYPQAQFATALLYESGKGVKKSMKKAILFYEKASDQAHAQAQYNLANIYLNGNTIQKDEKMAKDLMQRSYMNGFQDAKKVLVKNGWQVVVREATLPNFDEE